MIHFFCCDKLRNHEEQYDVVNKIVELNVALYAFVIIDDDGLRIIEHHPIDVISFASPGREDCLKGILCFVSNINKEAGRRCLVFQEPDGSVDFIMETMGKIFRLKNEGSPSSIIFYYSLLFLFQFFRYAITDHEYMNICSLPVAKGLDKKIWFHGEIDRASAESLLRNEGDFLVRLSRSTTNNFVLSGFTNSVPKHFLLLDENDLKVRKQSQVFETIVELIDHHRAWNVPIISEGSELHLIRPIVRGAATARR
ncbi:unnamed protein product [Dracunculus medinensis]|uniref:SH2 domain-containing protein n=1 Tax=Dracunculus medinensis TaxID=318479 RepID=A0A0N4UMS0_DRAME|nr:unnamed protein product [Dracunculus medinensis]